MREPPPSSERTRLELALQAAGLGEFQWNIAGDRLIVSARMAAITGLPAGEMAASLGALMERHAHPDDLPAFRAQRDAALQSGETFDLRFRMIRPDDGRTIWLRLAGIVHRDETGRAIDTTGIVEDISQSRLEEDQRHELMAELDHRVKNVLAAVQALAAQTAKRTTSLDVFLNTFSG
ncbi:MAG: PAS domain-containing protein, partial [Phenylobacterium sp.]|nr:PAS domain-containing protein [Phenylobacterium sp.]